MSKNAKTTVFLKECLSDSLIKLMKQKPNSKITIDEIALSAGVNRSTWFRNFDSKNEALTFKLVQLWKRRAEEHSLKEGHKYTVENALDFFQFNFDNRDLLLMIRSVGMWSVVYDAFYQIMQPQFGAEAEECYQAGFYSYGLFGLLGEWVKRDFKETPQELTQMFFTMLEIV